MLLSSDLAFNFVTANRHFLSVAVFSVQLHNVHPQQRLRLHFQPWMLPTRPEVHVSQNRVGGFPGLSGHVSGASATELLAVLSRWQYFYFILIKAINKHHALLKLIRIPCTLKK